MTEQEDIRLASLIFVFFILPCVAMILWVLVPELMHWWRRRRDEDTEIE